jgi:tRNA-dihydrouridine synthase
MQYYFAPMEGLTDSVFRRLHHTYFPGVDRYYMPFISPTQHRTLTNREARELPMADRVPFTAIPQVLTKVADDFVWAAGQCADRGYTEVNLNLGCPSGTVVSKGKGSGMLSDPDNLDRFLDAVFSASPVPVSVKSRLGLTDPQEFPRLLEIYNRYPIQELTLHPRVRKAFYSGSVDMEMFSYCAENSKNPVCYNGDICNLEDINRIEARFPQVHSVMIGRGLIGDPGMLTPGGTTVEALEEMFNALLDEYIVLFGGSRNAMFRLKEHWGMLLHRFEDSEKLGKRLRKTTDLDEYRTITQEIFRTLKLK